MPAKDTLALAETAMHEEGLEAWFPGYDIHRHWNLDWRLAAGLLAQWMDHHPDMWDASGDTWEFLGGDTWNDYAAKVLDDYAVDLGEAWWRIGRWNEQPLYGFGTEAEAEAYALWMRTQDPGDRSVTITPHATAVYPDYGLEAEGFSLSDALAEIEQ